MLIHGAAGNVGAYAVQLARSAGVRAIATAVAADTPFLRSLGADAVIDFRTQRFEEVVRDADAVIDLVGGETQQAFVSSTSSGRQADLDGVAILISSLRKAMASKPPSFLSMSQASAPRISPASSMKESCKHVSVRCSPSRTHARRI